VTADRRERCAELRPQAAEEWNQLDRSPGIEVVKGSSAMISEGRHAGACAMVTRSCSLPLC
jgi:hypothetical protein